MTTIAEVQRLLDWINGDLDAHTVLASIYTDPEAPQSNRVKAAAASLPFEKGKVLSVPPIQIGVELVPLAELLEMRRARQAELEGKVLDLLPNRNGGDQLGATQDAPLVEQDDGAPTLGRRTSELG